MTAFGLYLLKVNICLTVFYVLYIFLFKNYTFFRFNRYYLITGLVFSFLIPLVKFSLPDNPYQTLTGSFEQSLAEVEYTMIHLRPLNQTVTMTDYTLLAFICYLGGVLISLLQMIRAVFSIIHLRRNSEAYSIGGTTIVKTRILQPFSFVNMVFLPASGVDPLIMKHESAHVTQFHWIDLMLIELAVAVLWFNPLTVLYKRAIKLQHEYLADADTLGQHGNVEQYLKCLLQHVCKENTPHPISQFYSTSIKKRIMMITKDKTASKFSIAYFMLVPVVCLLLISFSNRPTSQAAPFEDGQKYVGEDIPSVSPIVIEKSLGIASDFGYRIDPITNKRKFHTGVDFRSSEGSLVMSTANGIVLESENDSSRGNFIVVKHGEMYMTSYSHLKSAAVTVGDLLAKGQTIGYVGNTGLSTAPHLHYEILKDGKPVDPKDYLPKVK